MQQNQHPSVCVILCRIFPKEETSWSCLSREASSLLAGEEIYRVVGNLKVPYLCPLEPVSAEFTSYPHALFV
jgi:hypothetical protein